tara:strand:- start:2542 stop:4164 length:1623 start_codon:yes stop_codon:yes gene_type:complete
MAKLLKLRRGTTTQHSSFTGAEGEVTIDTNKDVPVVHDGSTQGGHPVAAEDMSNVASASIKGRLGTTLTNAEINASAAIAGTKISPNFGSQNIVTTGSITCGGIGSVEDTFKITDSAGTQYLLMGNQDSAGTDCPRIFKVGNAQLEIGIGDSWSNNTGGTFTNHFSIGKNGQITSHQNHDFTAGIDVTGNITATGDATINGGDVTISGAGQPSLHLTDTSDNPDWAVQNNDGQFRVRDMTNGATRFAISTGGNATFYGDIATTGTVDTVDIAARDALFGGLTSSSGVLSNGVTATTQGTSDNSTKVATTAYVTTAVNNAEPFPSGTKMLFQQTAAPTGWTKVTSGVDNRALRVVSGTVGSGGSNAFSNTLTSRGITANAANATQGGNVSVSIGNSTVSGNVSVANATQGGNVSVSIANANTSGTVNSHTLSTNQMPSHSHSAGNSGNGRTNPNGNGRVGNTGGAGGSQGHSHGFSGGSHNHNANASFSGNAHSHNATFSGGSHDHNATGNFSGSAHNHSITVTNLDMAVQYLDVIIASKD